MTAMEKIISFCRRERCVWRTQTGALDVCARAKCPYGERASYIFRKKILQKSMKPGNKIKEAEK